MNNYKQIFGQAWKMTWHNRFFWFLGFLTIFFGGSIELELFDNFLGNKNIFFDINNFSTGGLFQLNFLTNLSQTAVNDFGGFLTIIGAFLGFAILFALMVLMASFSQTILINRVYKMNRIDNHIDSTSNGIKKIINEHKEQLVPISVLNIIYKIFVYFIFILISLPIMLTMKDPTLWSDGIYLVLFILLIPLAIIVAMIVKYAISYISVFNDSFKEAMKKAFRLFKSNWLASVEMSFALFIISVVGTIAAMIILYAIYIPLGTLTVFLSTTVSQNLLYPCYGGTIILLLAIFFILASILNTFYTISWANLFFDFNKNGQNKSKIIEVFDKFRKK